MQISSDTPARLANYFFEGVLLPQRFAEGLRLLAEMQRCEQAAIKFWDKRGAWACLRKARKMEAGWQFIAEDLAAPPQEWQAIVPTLDHGQWKRIKALRETRFSQTAGPDASPVSQTVMCFRFPSLRGVEALLLLSQAGPDNRQDNQKDRQLDAKRVSLPPDLAKSLCIALELAAQYRQLSQKHAYSKILLDTIRLPLLMVDHSLRLLTANRHAQGLIEPVTLGGKRCISLRGLSASRLSAAVKSACDPSAPLAGSVLVAGGAKGSASRILVLPTTARHAGKSERVALLLVHGQVDSQTSGHALLQQAYGLTPAEARLAMLIFEGHSPGDAATSLQVGIATVRTQLSAILKKTGARKQAELIRRLSPLLVLDRQQAVH